MPKRTADAAPAVPDTTRLDEVLDFLGVPSWQRSPLKFNYNAKCPVHNDRRASLSVGRKRDNPAEIGLHCLAGCDTSTVYAWFEKPARWFQEPRGWTPAKSRRVRGKGTPVETYPYYDTDGTELYRQTRYVEADGSKNWMVEHFVDTRLEPGKGATPDVLYNWPAVDAAIESEEPEIFVVEGEKDVETLRSWLKVGTTALSGNWTPDMLDQLSGALLVTVVADRDQKGYEQAHKVATYLDSLEIPYRVVRAAVRAAKADITDHLQSGLSFDDLETIEDVEALALEKSVLEEIRRIRVREEAQRRLAAASAAPIPEVKSLSDLLDDPDEDQLYRVDRIWPVEGHVLLSAQYKAGKTTMRNNLIQAVSDRLPFLGGFRTEFGDTDRIGVLDFEMGNKKNRRWLREMGIENLGAVDFLDMRGGASSLNLLDAARRREWSAIVRDRGWTIPILDPVSPALVALGLDENSNKDVRTFLNAWEEMLADAGVYESLVLHHSGHSGDRSRGAAAFRDWPAAYWDLNRERDKNGDTDDTAPSYFKAKGRDVDYPESELLYESTRRQLTIKEEGASRRVRRSQETKQARADRVNVLYEECVKWLESGPETVSARAWRECAEGSSADKDQAYRMVEASGLLARHTPTKTRRRSEGV